MALILFVSALIYIYMALVIFMSQYIALIILMPASVNH